MSILVTGGAGFIGSHTAVELLNAGKEIVIVDDFSNSKPKSLEAIKKITDSAEKSKEDEPIMLCMVIDKGKVIGAYLDYSGYSPGITSIDFKYNFKQL